MGKYRELEVITPVELVKPTDFIGGVMGVWGKLTSEKDKKQQNIDNIRMWSSGEIIRPLMPLIVVDPDKLEYFHFARLVDKVSNLVEPFDFYNLQTRIDPASLGKTEINNDLRTNVSDSLMLELGRCTLDQLLFKFDYIETVESGKYPGQKVFVLKRSPLVIEDENRRKKGQEAAIVDPLSEVSSHVSDLINDVSSAIHDLDSSPEIENGVPFARTKETDEDMLDEFRKTVFDQMFDPFVEVRAQPIDINW